MPGIDVSGALVGERWEVGSTVLEASEPRLPCWKLGVKRGDPLFVKQFAKALRPGTYLPIVTEGDVTAGDVARVVDRPGHDVSVGDVARAYLNGGDGAERLLDVPQLTNGWRAWATSRLRRPSPRSARA